MTHQSAYIINLDVRKEGDFYYVTSPNLIGLNVCGDGVEQTYQSVVKVIQVLFRHNRGLDVDVIPGTTDGASFPEAVGLCQQFVALRKAA